ncbi:sugar ABC transporter ATP-binding protein, partial [Halobacteriales archaeon SW_12_69_24]
QRLQRELEVTTVYVTHDQTEAMTIGDRIAVLRDGRLQQVATPMTCYHEPANRFVASFIGEPSMNLLECSFDPDSSTFDGPISYPATDRLAAAAADAAGRRLTLGFRPEAPAVTDDAGDGALAVPGHVEVVEPVGERSFVYVSLAAGPQVTVATPGRIPVGEGDRVHISLPQDGVHLFDAESGEALYHPDREDSNDQASGPPDG